MEQEQKNSSQSPVLLITVLVAMTFLLFVIVLFFSQQDTSEPADDGVYRGSVIDPPLLLDDFTMPATTGEDLSLSDFQGKWVLMFFGYTHCPDFCPTTLAEYRLIVQMLGDDAEELQVVFVSVDGERDTPDVLAQFLKRFNPDFIGLSGTDKTLGPIRTEFGLFYERQTETGSEADYLVDHTTRSYLIDPDGNLRIMYSYLTDREILTESIRNYIQEE